MNEYKRFFQTKEWKAKRERILERDGYKCKCGKTHCRLNVSSRMSLQYGNPLEIEDRHFEVLCNWCLRISHERKIITGHIRKSSTEPLFPRTNRCKGRKKYSLVWKEGKGLVHIENSAF